MDNTDLRNLKKTLQAVQVRLPQYQKTLRAHLLGMHRKRFIGRPLPLAHHKVTVFDQVQGGLIALGSVLGVVMVGVVILHGVLNDNPARSLALYAAQQVHHMSAAQLDSIRQSYRSLDTCLQEAAASDTLHLAAPNEVRAIVPAVVRKEHPAKVYLAYWNRQGHEIVIMLDNRHTPIYALDTFRNQG